MTQIEVSSSRNFLDGRLLFQGFYNSSKNYFVYTKGKIDDEFFPENDESQDDRLSSRRKPIDDRLFFSDLAPSEHSSRRSN